MKEYTYSEIKALKLHGEWNRIKRNDIETNKIDEDTTIETMRVDETAPLIEEEIIDIVELDEDKNIE